eukprot:5870385-Alexandrium_andersonii.AAC.1
MGMSLSKGKASCFLRDQTYNLIHMILTIKTIKKNSASGARLPSFIWDLCSLLETPAQGMVGEEDEVEGE